MAISCLYCTGPHPWWDCRKAPEGWKPPKGAKPVTLAQIAAPPVEKDTPSALYKFRGALATAKKALAEAHVEMDKTTAHRELMRDRRADTMPVTEAMVEAGTEVLVAQRQRTAEDMVEAIYRAMWRKRGKKGEVDA